MKKLILLFLILMPSVANAQLKITELTADASPSTDDLVVTVNDPAGTPATRKATIANLLRDATIPNNITIDLATSSSDLTCTDCINATEIEDIYTLNSGDTITGAVTINDNGGTGSTLLTIGDANDADSVAIFGDLTVTGDDITMGTNTSGHILVADGTNFNPVAMSGDVTIDSTGATTIGADKVALATDTTGNYVATIADSGASEVTVANSGTENAAVTLAIASGITRDTEWDTEGEVQTVWGTVNILLETEIDASSELLALMDDETGTGALVFADDAAINVDGGTLEIPNSITLPATCTVGQIYMDTDATSGQRIYACESTNTWALQGDGGGGGAGDVTAVGNCASGDCFTGASGTTLASNTDIILGLDEDNNGTESFQVLDGADALVAEVAESGLITTLVGLDAIGAVDMDYGSADVTDHTFVTDGTGDAEIVLPDGSISATEVLDNTLTASDMADSLDFGGDTSFEIPNGTSGTTDADGEIYLDTNGDGGTNFSGPVVQMDAGTSSGYLFPIALPLAASQDNYVLKYDATGKTVQWEADADSGGSTKWNAIADADGVGTVDFAGNDQDITSSEDGGDILTITTTDADQGFDTTILRLATNDTNDVNTRFLIGTIDEDGTPANDWIVAATGTAGGLTETLGSAGVKVTTDGDGAITFLGLGDGSDEDLTINLDDTSNTASVSSSTGVTTLALGALGITSTAARPLVDTSFNTSNSQMNVGSFEVQSYSLANSWIADNMYFNGSSFIHRATGAAVLFYFNGSEGQFRNYASATSGSSASAKANLKIDDDGDFAVGSSVSNTPGSFTGATLLHTGSTGTVTIAGVEAGNGILRIYADDGDDNPDRLSIRALASDGSMSFQTQTSGSDVEVMNLTNAGNLQIDGQFTASATSDIGWTIQSAANQACNTTCTSACVHGWETTSGEVAVACSDATADKCLCAGAS